MDTLTISAEPIDGYFESCYAAFLRGDPRPELRSEIEDTLTPDSRDRIDEVVERLRRRAEARRGRRKRRGNPKAAAGSSPEDCLKVPGYDITGLLGEGGFGRVYRAISRRHFGVPVALKILRPAFPPEAGPDAPERRLLMTRLLIGESQVLAHIGHRNVVRYLGSGIVESGAEAGTPFIATELIDGQSLAKRISQAPQDPRWSARILAQVADALDFVHQLKLQRSIDGDEGAPGSGILHRDVKPSNIVLGRGDQPILTDFGLAGRVGHASSDEGIVAGTAAYSAPEQLRADAVLTPAVDVYGLGATLYHLLTGQPPRREPTPADRGGAKAGPRLISPGRLAPRIPADLERVYLKCLQSDPSQRYQTAGAVRDDLQRFLDGKPVSIHPVGTWGRAVRWACHSPLAATLAASLVLALSIGLLATAWFWRRAEAERLRVEAKRVRADSERREAEADFEVANEVLGGLAEWTSWAFSRSPAAASWDSSLIPMLRRGRQQLLALARRRPAHLTMHKWLTETDTRLAAILINTGGQDEARALLVEALESLDKAIAEVPVDLAVLTLQRMTYEHLGLLAEREGKVEDSIDYLARVIAVRERLMDLGSAPAPDTFLADQRYSLAMWFAQNHQEARARSLIEANVRMLDNDPHGASDPAITLRRVFAHEDLRQLGTNGRYELNASAVVAGTDPLSRLISPEADDLSAEDWASAFIQLLSMSPTSGGTSPTLEPDVIESFVLCIANRAAERRHANRPDQARQVADRLHAVARQLVTRYPNQATAHWALSYAYIQIHKNAWQTSDRATVERYLKLGVDTARHALVLDPGNSVVRRHLADYQKRLDNLLSPPNSVDASEPSARSGMRN
jgi:serine/threonine protein kinase